MSLYSIKYHNIKKFQANFIDLNEIYTIYLMSYTKFCTMNFIPEDGGSMFLQNIGYLPTSPHGITTQKSKLNMF
jgi:hypothetical protein